MASSEDSRLRLSDEQLLQLAQGNTFERVFREARLVSLPGEIEEALLRDEAVEVRSEGYVPHFPIASQLRVRHLSLVLDMLDSVVHSGAPHAWYSDFVDALGDHVKLETLRLGFKIGSDLPRRLGEMVRALSLGVRQDAIDGMVRGLENPLCRLEELEIDYHWSAESDGRLIRAITSTASLQSLTVVEFKKSSLAELFCSCIGSPSCNIWDLRILHKNGNLLNLARALENPDCSLLSLRLHLWDGPRHQALGHDQFLRAVQGSRLQHLTMFTENHELVEALEDLLQVTDLKLRSLWLATSCPIQVTKLFNSSLTHLHLYLPSTNLLFADLAQFMRLLGASQLRHLRVQGTDLVPVTEQRKVLSYLDKTFDCPLETLELWRWETEVLQRSCLQILKRNKLYREGGLLEEGQVKPSNAKLFLCGDAGVGKTTIRKNLSRKYGLPDFFQSSLSTYGIRLHTLRFGDKKLLVCDLAGQPEYHAFHHYFIRGSDKDLFLLVCKAPVSTDEPAKLERHLRYWLRFIVAHRSLSERQPRVLILFNYFPNSERPQNRTSSTMQQLAFIRCSTVIQEYSQYIDFGEVYGLIATSVNHVSKLKHGLKSALYDLLESRPKIPEVCRHFVDSMNATARARVLSLEEFKSRYSMRNFTQNQFKACITHLHDIGELIYFEQDGRSKSEQFVILDVQWFLQDIIGVFLPRFYRTAEAEVAQVPTMAAVQPVSEVKARIAAMCDADHVPFILTSLEKLGVVLVDNNLAQVIVLPLLEDQIQQWQEESNKSGKLYSFWGRRLDCKDSARMLLPSGIFNMLQVKLAGMFSQHKFGQGWLYLVENRIHIIVKVGGTRSEWYDRHWVDILVRIPFDLEGNLLEQAETLFKQVKLCIAEVCGAPNWGCPAIELEEKVVSPNQVEKTPGSNFEEVHPLHLILQEMRDGSLLYEHTWPSLQSTAIFELLLPSERRSYISNKQNEIKCIEMEVLECLKAENNAPETEASRETNNLDGLAIADKIILQVKRSELEILKQVNQSEARITNEIHRLELITKKQLEGIQQQGLEILSKLILHLTFDAPKYPYVTDNNNFLQRLSPAAFGSTWRLHFLCESPDYCHPVENQKGVEFKASPEWLSKAAPLLVPALRMMFFALKVVSIAGFGVAIPTSASDFPNGLRDASIQAVLENVFGKVDEHLKSRIPTQDELKEFHATMSCYLKGRNLEADLGLYRRVQHGQHIWLCKKHANGV